MSGFENMTVSDVLHTNAGQSIINFMIVTACVCTCMVSMCLSFGMCWMCKICGGFQGKKRERERQKLLILEDAYLNNKGRLPVKLTNALEGVFGKK